MRIRLSIVIGLGLLLFAGGHACAQTVYGPGGLFVHATAFTQPRDSLTFNVSYLTQRGPGGRPEQEYLPVSLVKNIKGQADVGVLFISRSQLGTRRESGGVFVKYALCSDSEHRPAIAIAGSFLAGEVRQSSITLVASHQINRIATLNRPLATVHVGLQYGRRDDVSPASDGLSAYVGASVPLGHDFALVGEIGTQFNFDYRSASGIGIQYTGKGYALGVGYVNTGRSETSRFFVGVGFGLGGGRR